MNAAHELVRLLEVEPGLGEDLPAERLPAARGSVVASAKRLAVGSWHPDLGDVPQVGYLADLQRHR